MLAMTAQTPLGSGETMEPHGHKFDRSPSSSSSSSSSSSLFSSSSTSSSLFSSTTFTQEENTEKVSSTLPSTKMMSNDPARLERKERHRWADAFWKSIRHLVSDLSESELRDLLSTPQENPDYSRLTFDSDVVFKYIPREFEGREVDLDNALSYLNTIIDLALYRRLYEVSGIETMRHERQEGKFKFIVYYWPGTDFVLPEFLRDLPTIVVRESDSDPSEEFTWDRSEPIDRGCKLYPWSDYSDMLPQFLFPFGTLGFVATFVKNDHRQHVLVTVGHIMDTDDAFFKIETNTNDPTQLTSLHPIDHCKRETYGIPKFRMHSAQNPCLDEICLVSTEGLSENLLKCRFPSPVHCNVLFPIPSNANQEDIPSYPGLLEKFDTIQDALRQLFPLQVYKYGAKTQLTMGYMIDIVPYSRIKHKLKPRSSHVQHDAQNQDGEVDENDPFCFVIRWESQESPFADSGDSGSLVYTMHNNQVVPLGIHFGSYKKKCKSYSFPLWYWCQELEGSLDADLLFCSPPHCSRAGAVSNLPLT